MKKFRLLSLLLVLSILCSFLIPSVQAADLQFNDVAADQWYYSYVYEAYHQGLMVGTGDATFEPEATMTRAMFVTVLGRSAGISTEDYTSGTSFADVEEGQWYSPYVEWAQETGITNGISDTLFGTDDLVTREQMATFLARYLSNSGKTLPDASNATAYFSDASNISDWAQASVEQLRASGLFQGDETGCFLPADSATRAEAATVFVRLTTALKSDVPVLPDVANPVVSNDGLLSAAETYGLDTSGNAFAALISMNTVYSEQLTASQRSGILVFLFEGVGSTDDPNVRMNAMCVVVKSNQIVYLTLNASTIPDYPFDPSANDGAAMPTLKSGIYAFNTVNHVGRVTVCAALNVLNAKVVRFSNQNTCYDSTSTGIHIHRRNSDAISATLPNSAGCILIGKAGTAATDEYAMFVKALGIVPATADGTTKYTSYKTGTVIVDRSYAYDYLSAVGYPESSIAMIG